MGNNVPQYIHTSHAAAKVKKAEFDARVDVIKDSQTCDWKALQSDVAELKIATNDLMRRTISKLKKPNRSVRPQRPGQKGKPGKPSPEGKPFELLASPHWRLRPIRRRLRLVIRHTLRAPSVVSPRWLTTSGCSCGRSLLSDR